MLHVAYGGGGCNELVIGRLPCGSISRTEFGNIALLCVLLDIVGLTVKSTQHVAFLLKLDARQSLTNSIHPLVYKR